MGEDENGAVVTVLSALARLGLEPWTEASELASLGRGAAQTRLKTHLSAIGDIPALEGERGEVATRLISLLPQQAPPYVSNLVGTIRHGGFPIPVSWLVVALVAAAVLARIFQLAQAG